MELSSSFGCDSVADMRTIATAVPSASAPPQELPFVHSLAFCRGHDGLSSSRMRGSSSRRWPKLSNNSRNGGKPLIVRCLCHSFTAAEAPMTACFSGIGDTEEPVLLCKTETLPTAVSLFDAKEALTNAVIVLQSNPLGFASGILRFQIPLSVETSALKWLQSQPAYSQLLPRLYFSPRGQRGEGYHDEDADIFKGVAGIGSAVLFNGSQALSSKDLKSIKRFLSKDSPLIRAYGAIRFDAEMEPSAEWKPFGSFFFFVPQIEFCECPSCSLLAVTIAWDDTLGWSFGAAVAGAIEALGLISDQVPSLNASPFVNTLYKQHVPCEQVWHDIVKDILQRLELTERKHGSLAEKPIRELAKGALGLSKVVLARKTKIEVDVALEPLALVAGLQEKDSNAYQFCIQLANGSAFFGSTPERLFYRDGFRVFSEAVAATRGRGVTESKDNVSSIDLLLSTKDHSEFDIVMESVKQQLWIVCEDVEVDSYKGLIKQANVQHLYGRLGGKLRSGCDEFELLSVLHPTPAVCGHPQIAAKIYLSETETFDRGMYAGPFGWISGDRSEFAVAIRSALMEPNNVSSLKVQDYNTLLHLYAGVGIVKGAKSLSEWRELDLKIRQFEALLQPFQPLEEAPNINSLWARLIVEECCRLGVTYFCIAPGSRSSPLAVAAAETYRANCVSCIDERSLGFHALGYGRGAHKPAVVITSSGTAVSNLLPAVVEASEDCVPMILLTADRPPELQDVGANQTIDQIKHFGSFIRYNVNLTPPIDSIQSRYVLTSIDAAIFRAFGSPAGPVHINIPFREPLAETRESWNLECLNGLERWASGSLPFTKYIKANMIFTRRHPFSSIGQLKEVVELIEAASKGLLIIGGLHTAEEARAVLCLAEHLQWPVVADILSGVRSCQSASTNIGVKVHMIDYFDHVLLNTTVHSSIKPDIVIQIGSRLTSKRLAAFLEACHLVSYVLVEEHPFRRDPSHLLTHRVQASVVNFVSYVVSCVAQSPSHEYAEQLGLLSNAVGQEVMFQMDAELGLTEPHIVRIAARSLPLESALFIGNSMAVRDADMYLEGTICNQRLSSAEFDGLPKLAVRTAGNRGASGIDGVLSTAIGFAAGSMHRVTLLVGDVSFLHDTNGLMLMKRRAGQPPVVIILVNNFGGGIFSLLPIANTAPAATFTSFFTTPHDVSVRQLCLAHRVNHTRVQSREQLVEALDFIQKQNLNWIVEVESNVEGNADFHRYLQHVANQAVKHAFQILYSTSSRTPQGALRTWIVKEAIYFSYRIPLYSCLTSKPEETHSRIGFIFCITLCSGVAGYGEVAPLPGLHKESFKDAEEQLRLLIELLRGVEMNCTLALMNGSFSEWLLKSIGVRPEVLFPSVRCGLEMAVLGVLAAVNRCTFFELLGGSDPLPNVTDQNKERSRSGDEFGKVQICALLDSIGTPADMASAAFDLVNRGYRTLKVKVGRRVSPLEDAAVLLAIRQMVGPHIHLRADANQHWTYVQAMEFAFAAHSCGLQYLEEPLKNSEDIIKFCKETGMPVAVDETIDKFDMNTIQKMGIFSHPGVVAVVIKPSSVGGFEQAAFISKWAQKHGMLVIISAAFESSLSLASYAQFAAFVDKRRLESITASELARDGRKIPAVAHGLGTFLWLKDDVVNNRRFAVKREIDGVEISINDAAKVLETPVLDKRTVMPALSMEQFCSDIYTVKSSAGEYAFHVLDTNSISQRDQKTSVLVFFHGFLGTSRDWLPIMKALSLSNRCISIDLPGHGETTVHEKGQEGFETALVEESAWSMKYIAEALASLLDLLKVKQVILVGYSMGARLALYMALRCNSQVAAAVIISGSPGLQDPLLQKDRAVQDDALAQCLQSCGLEAFIDSWYKKRMWKSLRSHPIFATLKSLRQRHQDLNSLARILSSMSLGRQPSLWEDLAHAPIPLLFIAGKDDPKSLQIAHKMCNSVQSSIRFNASSRSPNGVPSNLCTRISKNFQDFADQEITRLQLKEALALNQQPNECEKCQQEMHDELVGNGGVINMRTVIQNKGSGNVVEVAYSGHAVHLENPFDLVKSISKFVSKLAQYE